MKRAVGDLVSAIQRRRVWMHLGWVEVKQRYRRSALGPWWISLSMLIFILMMGIIFSQLLHQELAEYIPFFTAGFLFWSFISTSIIEGAEIFKSNSGFIKQINLPYSLYVLKHIVRQVICLLHHLVIYLLICLFFKVNPGVRVLLVFPGFLLLVVNLYWVCLLIGMVSARFRDMVPIINSCVQIAFFVTPISWMPRLLDPNSALLQFNPLVYLLDVVRSPLLGALPSVRSWLVVSAMALIGSLISFWVFARARPRIAFWVD